MKANRRWVYRKKFEAVGFVLMVVILAACHTSQTEEEATGLFTLLPPSETNIEFINQLKYDEDFNIYTYRNFYNGGGVALGDINRDSLVDIYFTANMKPNRLYLNQGNFQFEDITEQAGVVGERAWSTGVSMADVNGDGWLDIYVCNSGDIDGDNKQNELYINNGDDREGGITFTESAEAYGLADQGYSTHAAFFDYDKDGDLDMYLLNNSYQAIGSFNLRKNERPNRDPVGGDKLFRNDGDRFTDVSEEAGIYGSIIGFGLGVTVGDLNQDGWQDIYVSNDFFERDYIYMNNQDGTFTEDLENQMYSISGASMGADMADVNNDGYPDIFVTEMLPSEERRLKTKTTFENWDRYQYNLKNGYYHQFTRNMLQLNIPVGTDPLKKIKFSEIGRLAGVHATDWSWGALIADYNNDGHKDIFVANGIYQDLTDQDYIQYISNEETIKQAISGDRKVNFKQLIDAIPSERIPNFMFVSNGDCTFTDHAGEWGLSTPSHSNGSAYGDLDNDGDLDLVVNNVNMPAFVYRNNANNVLNSHYLKIALVGEGKNRYAFGAQVRLKAEGQLFYQEQMPVRGFQSTVDHRLNFGLGSINEIDTLEVQWPNGKVTILEKQKVDQTLTLHQKDAQSPNNPAPARSIPLFAEVEEDPLFVHHENDFVDFDRDRLLFHMLSREGPCSAQGDVNGDGFMDIFLGGAKGQAGVILVQQPGGKFARRSLEVFEQDKTSEDTDALFFDADNDNDQDLYVASGGNEFPTSSSALLDRLYLNDGRGNFTKSNQLLPTSHFESTGAVAATDYDQDGDQDLFVGLRLRPFLYGVPVDGYLLQNDGQGKFQNVTDELAPELKKLGMITDAIWSDIDGDQDADLLVVGEWMPISVFKNEEGRLVKSTKAAGLVASNGWWNTIVAADLDRDGDMDFVVGNHGLNSRFKASKEEPVTLYTNDFDRNGTAEQIVTVYNGDHSYPLVLKHDLVMQMPSLKKKYLKYASYKEQTIEEIFSPDQLEKAVQSPVYEMATSVLINQGDGAFTLMHLPMEAQFSPVYGISVADFDNDQVPDIVLGGNLYAAKPEVGIYDASHGLFLKGHGDGQFTPVSTKNSGLLFSGEIRELALVKAGTEAQLWAVRNNDAPQIFSIQYPAGELSSDR